MIYVNTKLKEIDHMVFFISLMCTSD